MAAEDLRQAEAAHVDASPRSILRLPYDSPVRRLAVQLAAREAIERRDHVCQCGERYLAIGRPATFHHPDRPYSDPELVCRKCRLPL